MRIAILLLILCRIVILSPVFAEDLQEKPTPKPSIKKKWEWDWIPDERSNRINPKFSHDETMYLHAGRLYSLESGRLLHSQNNCLAGFFDQENRPFAICWSPKSLRFLTIHGLNKNAEITIHWKTWEDIRQVFPFSSDRILAWGHLARNNREFLVLFDPAKLQAIKQKQLEKEEYAGTRQLFASSDGRAIAIIQHDERLCEMWRLSDGAILSKAKMPWAARNDAIDLKTFADPVGSITVSPDLKYIAYHRIPLREAEQTIQIIDPKSGKEIKRITTSRSARGLKFCRDNKWLISTHGAIQVWDISTGENLVASAYRKEASPEQVVGVLDDRLDIAHLLGLRFEMYSGASTAAYSNKLNRLAVYDSSTSQLSIMSIPDFHIHASIKVNLPPRQNVDALYFSPSGKYLVGRGIDEKLIVWEVEQGDS